MKTAQTILLSIVMFGLNAVRVGAVGGPEIVIVTPPLSLGIGIGGSATFAVVAVGAGTLNYQWRHGAKIINEANGPILTIANAQIADAGEYVVKIIRGGQAIETIPAVLTVAGVSVQDLSGPKLDVKTPPGSLNRIQEEQFTFSGTADDDTGVTGIYYQQDGGSWVTLPPDVDWSCAVTLHPGTNVFLFKASDLVGNYSDPKSVVVFRSVTEPLALAVVGNGQVAGAVNGQSLEVGRSYALRAVPTTGNYFSHWDANGVISTEPTLNLLMSPGATITAHFVANPFLTLQGTYTALFYDASNLAHETSGLLSFKLTTLGRFSGKLILGGISYSCSGQFGMDLRAETTIVRSGTNPSIVVALQLSTISDRLTGSVGVGTQSSTLDGYRSVFHSTLNPAASFAGKYTVSFLGDGEPSTPQGNGCGTITVTTAGAVTFAGALGEGTSAAQKLPLASNGQWALYVPLHKGKGSILGWITLGDTGGSDVTGSLLWTKPSGAGVIHSAGFVSDVTTIGSRYLAPSSGSRVLNFSNSVVQLEGGNLAVPLAINTLLNELNKVSVLSAGTTKFAVSLSASSGLLSGSFINPQTLKKSVIKGALLQRQSLGSGYFLGTNQSGSFRFSSP